MTARRILLLSLYLNALAIRQETEQAMTAALGEKAFKTYKSWNNG